MKRTTKRQPRLKPVKAWAIVEHDSLVKTWTGFCIFPTKRDANAAKMTGERIVRVVVREVR